MNDFLARAGYTIFHPKLHPYTCPYGRIRPAFLLFSKILPSTIPYGSILCVDGSARAVFRAWMAAHGQYFARGWQRTGSISRVDGSARRTSARRYFAAFFYCFVHAPISQPCGTFFPGLSRFPRTKSYSRYIPLCL